LRHEHALVQFIAEVHAAELTSPGFAAAAVPVQSPASGRNACHTRSPSLAAAVWQESGALDKNHPRKQAATGVDA